LVWRTEKPLSAKKAGIGALVSVILEFVIGIIGIIIYVVALAALMSNVAFLPLAALAL
jgi:hypothetical protein